MEPKPAASIRPTSEKRAAAARANGAKSRGPVTAQGRANSSRNSRSHGLRSHALFTDPASIADLAIQLAAFEKDFAPQTGIERSLVRMMAVAHWRQTCLRKLETAVFNREIQRLDSLVSAYRHLSDHTCFLQIFSRLESRVERQYLAALKTWNDYRADRIRENVNVNERTQQVTENTRPPCDLTIEIAALRATAVTGS